MMMTGREEGMVKKVKHYYAHTKEGLLPEEWQPLGDHLKQVAERARSFAAAFGAGGMGIPCWPMA